MKVKKIEHKLRTTLSNRTLAMYEREALTLMIGWIRAGRLPSCGVEPVVGDPNVSVVAKPRVEDVGNK